MVKTKAHRTTTSYLPRDLMTLGKIVMVIVVFALALAACSSSDDGMFKFLQEGEVVYLLPLSENDLRVRTLREQEGRVQLGLEIDLRFEEADYEIQLRDEDGTLLAQRTLEASDCNSEDDLKLQAYTENLPGGSYHIAIVGRNKSSGRTSSVRMFPFMLEK